jgi:multidrug efflux system membrane fusion protein
MLYPNQFVNARLLVSTMQDAVRVPVPAVQHGEPGSFVYLINGDNTVSVRPIKVGPTDGNFEAVLSGLNPGDRVVTDGTDRLRDGAVVTLPSAGAQKGGPPTQGGPPGQGVPPGHSVPPGQSAPPVQDVPPVQGQAADPKAQHEHHRQPATQ